MQIILRDTLLMYNMYSEEVKGLDGVFNPVTAIEK